jgi:hypothetical protein
LLNHSRALGSLVSVVSDLLDIYLRSLENHVLVLPGHNLPFFGLYARLAELAAHHEARCIAIIEECRRAPYTTADLVASWAASKRS